MTYDGIILAAGFSKRVGAFKMGLKFGTKTVLETTLENMYKGIGDNLGKIYIVGGYKIDKIRSILDTENSKYPYAELVENQQYQLGMFSSVCTGIRQITSDKFFLIPGDFPLVKPYVYQRLMLENYDITSPSYNKQGGHPVLIDSKHIPEILAIGSNGTLRNFIYSHKVHYVEIEDNSIRRDIDYMEDYHKMIEDKGE